MVNLRNFQGIARIRCLQLLAAPRRIQEFFLSGNQPGNPPTLAVARRAEALFTDVGDEWLRLHSATLRSHRENEIRWNHRIKAFFSGLTLAAVTSSKVLEFKAELLAQSGIADGTRNQYLQQTRAVLRYAVAAGYVRRRRRSGSGAS